MDEYYIKYCLQLAQNGAGYVSPNPMVGAVLVYENEIIGSGWHEQYGGPHAEVNCINSVPIDKKHLIAKSTLYVSLEPCNHFGKRPPCSNFIIENNIKKVVVGALDSNKSVTGNGIEKLKNAEISVISGICEQACNNLNKFFCKYNVTQMPYITLKWAQSNDGFIARQNENTKITNSLSDIAVHKIRSEYDAILVGKNTVIIDNPKLDCRKWNQRKPLRILIDSHLTCNHSNLYLDEYPTLIFNFIKNENINNKEFILLNNKTSVLSQVLQHLSKLKINSLLVEGGAYTHQQFIEENLWDEAICITNSKLNLIEGISSCKIKNDVQLKNYHIENDNWQIMKNSCNEYLQ